MMRHRATEAPSGRIVFLLSVSLCLSGQLCAQTNPFTMHKVVLMLPTGYAGSAITEMTFDVRPRDGILYLWPRAADTGGGGTNLAGITNINGITNASQTFAVGTAGADFAISSAGSTHTFNLPTASAVNRGALSASDWNAFNGKLSGLNPDQFTGTNIKSGALLTNLNVKADAGASRALLVETNILLVTNGQVAIRVPPDANGYLTVEGAALTGIVVKHSTGSPRTLFGSAEVGTLTDTTLVIDVNGGQRWNFGDSTLSYALYPGTSNTTDFARSTLPARNLFVGTNDSREIHGRTAFFTNDVTMTAGKVITPSDSGAGGQSYLGVSGTYSGVFDNSGNSKIAAYDPDGSAYSYANNKFVYDASGDQNQFTAGSSIFHGRLDVSPHNTYSLAQATERFRDGWFANTLNTTGLVAGITYAPALVSGGYTNATNNLTVMMPNGSVRTNTLNSSCGVGAIQAVFDRLGTASGTNIIVKATSGNVHNAATDTISTAFGCNGYQWDGTNWWRIWKNG